MNADFLSLARVLAPEAALIVSVLAVLAADLTVGRGRSLSSRLHLATAIGALGLLVAAWFNARAGSAGPVFAGALLYDTLTVATRYGLLALTLLVLGVSTGARLQRHPAEYVAILLLATVGFTVMAAANQLLVAFLALELASLSLYILAGFDKTSRESAEAGLKYFLFGGMSAAFVLYGFSLLYGLTGSIQLSHISSSLLQQGMSPLLLAALVMVLVAFGFKAAAAPFHLWAPDAYQGAPTPSAALIASASKLAGLVLFARLFWSGLAPVAGNVSYASSNPGWLVVLVVFSGTSLLIGNLGALAQTNVRRLLAYSAIAHAGALILGLIAASKAGPSPLFYYAATYGIATAGAFGVIGIVERNGGCEALGDLAGLHKRSPLLAGCLMVFLLSLAGVPPLAGFFGKFAVFAAALQLGGLAGPAGWLTVFAILMSAVGLYYYLLVLKQALVVTPDAPKPAISVPLVPALTLIAAVLATVVLGLFPSLLLGVF